jgi:hypothetical protein
VARDVFQSRRLTKEASRLEEDVQLEMSFGSEEVKFKCCMYKLFFSLVFSQDPDRNENHCFGI